MNICCKELMEKLERHDYGNQREVKINKVMWEEIKKRWK
jgi:hypothetical protein